MENELEQQEQINDVEARALLHDCYIETYNYLRKYMDTSEQNYKFIALWIIGTYFHRVFDTYPYLFFNAMRGSGKTRALKFISTLGAGGDGSVQNNLTEAVLFRIPKHTTTCIDEVEGIGSKEKQTIRELLNSSYKKGMKVKRMKKVKENGQEVQKAEVFEPYFPIAMANIWGVEEVLADRSIVLILEKSNNEAIVKLVEDFDRNLYMEHIKRTLEKISCSLCSVVTSKKYIERWNKFISDKYTNTLYTYTTITTLTTQTKLFDRLKQGNVSFIERGATEQNEQLNIEQLFNKIDNLGIYGRNLELMFPLLIVSMLIGDDILDDTLKIASNIIQQKKSNEYADSKDVQVYEFIASIEEYGDTLIGVKELLGRFRTFIGESDEEDKWLNDKWLGRAIKRLNLVTYRKRFNTGMFVKLDYEKAKRQVKLFQDE